MEKRLALQPEEVINQTLSNTTQHYLQMEYESRDHPRRYIETRTPGLRQKILNEIVATDTLFSSVKSDRGITCIQFFTGCTSKRWEVYPLKSEAYNFEALQDFCRQVGIQIQLGLIIQEENRGRNGYSTAEISV